MAGVSGEPEAHAHIVLASDSRILATSPNRSPSLADCAPTPPVDVDQRREGQGNPNSAQGESPHASDGLIASHQHVWNDQGQLLASGISHLLCRRVG